MKQIQLIVLGVLAAIGILWAMAGITIIVPGEVGILVKMLGSDRGMQEETLDTGWRWVNPLTYDVAVYDARFKQYNMNEMSAETKDGQPIVLDISFEIGLKDSQVPLLHETVGRDWYDQVVFPKARAAVRNATSAEPSDQIYTSEGRNKVATAVNAAMAPLAEQGIMVQTNVRNLEFANMQFIQTLEQKATAEQKEEIERRLAKAAAQEAIKVANVAEGNKQKTIKEAEASNQSAILQAQAQRESDILKGQGERLMKEEQALGILAIATAEAEGVRLQVNAYGSGATYASVKWAESIGPKFQVYGVPVGAEGTTTIMDIAGTLSGMGGLK